MRRVSDARGEVLAKYIRDAREHVRQAHELTKRARDVLVDVDVHAELAELQIRLERMLDDNRWRKK